MKWSLINNYKDLKVIVETPNDLTTHKAIDANIFSSLKVIRSFQVAIGWCIEEITFLWAIHLH
jgi:hypothetical protein